MYAVFQSSGKQYRVKKGQTVILEKLNIAVGKTVVFEKVTMIVNGDDIKIGGPFLLSSKIEAEVIDHSRADKVMIVKFHRRKHFRKHQGHRQWFTNVRITDIYT